MRRWGRAVVALALLGALAPTAASAVSIETVGPPETVFDHDTMSCFFNDSPDGTVRAFRDDTGRVQVLLRGAHTRMIGPDLYNLTHDCKRVFNGLPVNPYPWEYDYADWLAAPWTDDGRNLHALVHAEYHGWRIPGWCPGEPFQKCRYNTITFARSTDAGESYQHGPGGDWLVAALPYRYVPGDGRYGYFSPSNIVERDGWHYSLIMVSQAYREQQFGTCLIRTRNVADPKSWRAWDGDGFNVRFVDPYRESPEPVGRHVCQPVSPVQIREMARNLTYNTFLGKYIVTGVTNKYDPVQDRRVYGFYFSTSEDLINWTDRQLLMETETLGTYLCGDENPRLYPGFLDPASPERNFSVVGEYAHLYFVEMIPNNCVLGRERDQVRIPVRFVP
jgi:hypothetical protein